MTTESTELVLAHAASELATATSIQDLKEIHNVAEAVRIMSKKVGKGLKEQNKAAEIKIRSERKLGQMLAEIELGQGKRTDLVATRDQVKDDRPTLKELGISKSDSSRWQKLASIPEPIFDGHIQKVIDAGKELTTVGMVRLAKSYQRMIIDVTPSDNEQQSAMFITSFEDVRQNLPQFSCVYLDPIGLSGRKDASAVDVDNSLADTFDILSKLPIKEITSLNAHLHLWTPDDLLNDACWLITQWGFRLASTFVWVKSSLGAGPYWRKSHELLLTASRGDLPFKTHSLRSWQELAPGADGEKPEGVRRLIEAASPGPYLELFGHREIPGWVVVGNQVLDPAKPEALSPTIS